MHYNNIMLYEFELCAEYYGARFFFDYFSSTKDHVHDSHLKPKKYYNKMIA